MLIEQETETQNEIAQLSLLIIQIEQERYALPSNHIREVTRYRELTPVPGAPESLPGIINNHGTIVPIANLRLILHFPSAGLTRSHRLVICHYEGVDLALHVDKVIDLTTIPANKLAPVPSSLDPGRAILLNGIVIHDDLPVALLNLKAIITSLRDWT